MAEKNYNDYSGNKFSLRAKTGHMIKRVDFISNNLGSLGDLLVTTWQGIAMGIVVLGLGAIILIRAGTAHSMNTFTQNLFPMFLVLIGVLLVALNAILTNPSMGSQFMVSVKFIIGKIKSRGKEETIDFKPFRFVPGIVSQSIVETMVDGRTHYFVIYRVKGSISPVSFENELNNVAEANERLLENMEKDTVISTVNSIQSAVVQKRKLPKNATEAMRKKRDTNYEVASSLPYNQQLKTLVIIDAMDLDILRSRMDSTEVLFRQGLTIGYQRLQGKDLKDAVDDIYGEEKWR